jgi:hypothetical protein
MQAILHMIYFVQLQAAIQPIGKFIPPDDVALPSSSGADLNNVDL